MLTAAAAVAIGGLSACSSDSGAIARPPSSDPTAATTSWPTDPDTAVLSIGRPGDVPRLVIGGDGWLYVPAGAAGQVLGRTVADAVPAAVPAPPAPGSVVRRKLSELGLQRLFAAADELGLLAPPPEYADPGITDMSSTEVVLHDGNGRYDHVAYALGAVDETGARGRLLDFVHQLDELPTLVGIDELGPPEPYEPTTFDVQVDGGFLDGEVRAWPANVAVVEGCGQLPVIRFDDPVAGLYRATVDGTEVRVAVFPDLPGDAC